MPETYIEECCINRHPVKVYTVNGFQMVGVIIAHDDDTIVLASDTKKRLIFKHAISTIEPAKS